MDRSQSRYFATAQRMDEALVNLLAEKDFEFVTVKEICERAQVSRSTFYLHYRTMGDLLDECVDGVMRRFLSYFEGLRPGFQAEIGFSARERLITMDPEFVEPYLSFVKENRRVFKAALERPQTMRTDVVYRRLFGDVIEPVLQRFGIPEGDRQYYALFYLSGITAIVQEWVRRGCADDVAHVAVVIAKCVLPDGRAGGE